MANRASQPNSTALLFQSAHRKLVEGTEVLRTGGGTKLTAGECNAILDHLADLERDLDEVGEMLRSETGL